MPPTRRSRMLYVNDSVLNSLTVKQLREMCQSKGLPSTCVRSVLQDANTGQERPQNVPQQPLPQELLFSEEQLHEIKTIIKDAVRETSRDIATEAAQATVKLRHATEQPIECLGNSGICQHIKRACCHRYSFTKLHIANSSVGCT